MFLIHLPPVSIQQEHQVHLANLVPKSRSTLSLTDLKMLFISAYIKYFLQLICFEGKIEKSRIKGKYVKEPKL